ncbi:MAG: hypothetical protein QM736_15670 [Vicinamibacterales bacterium]
MARIDWLVGCDMAFFDRQDRLCVVGMITHLPVPRLPLAIHQLTLVGKLADVQMEEEFDVRVEVVLPSGLFSCPRDPRCINIELAGQYVLVTLRDVPLTEEGAYRFEVTLGEQPPASVEIPVLSVRSVQRMADVH